MEAATTGPDNSPDSQHLSKQRTDVRRGDEVTRRTEYILLRGIIATGRVGKRLSEHGAGVTASQPETHTNRHGGRDLVLPTRTCRMNSATEIGPRIIICSIYTRKNQQCGRVPLLQHCQQDALHNKRWTLTYHCFQ